MAVKRVKGVMLTLVVAFVGLAFCWYVMREASQLEENRKQAQFDRSASLLVSQVKYLLSDATENVVKLSVLMDDFSQLNIDKYKAFLSVNNKRTINRSVLVYLNEIKGAEVEAYQAQMRGKVKSDFTVWAYEKAYPKLLSPVETETYYVVENELLVGMNWSSLVGLDLGSLDGVATYIAKAKDKQQPSILPVMTAAGVVQSKNPVMIVFLALTDKKQGRQTYLGHLLFLNEVLSPLSRDQRYAGLQFSINDVSFGFNDKGMLTVLPPPPASVASSGDYNHYQDQFTTGQTDYTVKVQSNSNLFAADHSSVYLVGLVSFALLVFVLYMVISQLVRVERVEKLVAQRTIALRKAHAELEDHFRTLQHLNAEMREARGVAEKANRAKSEFLATISHELRTPLNSILGFSQILSAESMGPIGNPRYKDYAESINTSGKHLLEMINDILDLAKLEAKRLAINPTPVDVIKLFNDVVTLMSAQANAKQLALSCTLSPQLPEMIMEDEKRLKQIMLNLVSNAVKFTQSGSVSVVVSGHEERAGSPYWMIEVKDTGIGIDADKLPLLFERFSQLDPGIAREYGGTGLGLAICKELIALMGGTIQVESQIDVGTTFRVILPLVELSDNEYDSLNDQFL